MFPGIFDQDKLFDCSKGNGITIKASKINRITGNKHKPQVLKRLSFSEVLEQIVQENDMTTQSERL